MSITPWEKQGCAECRKAWSVSAGSDPQLERLGTSMYRHAHLFRCRVCGAYWEECERYAHQIPEAEAKVFFANDKRVEL